MGGCLEAESCTTVDCLGVACAKKVCSDVTRYRISGHHADARRKRAWKHRLAARCNCFKDGSQTVRAQTHARMMAIAVVPKPAS